MAISTGSQALAADVIAAIAERFSSGSYTGNDTADRAIPHGLGATPRIVLITATADMERRFRIQQGLAAILYAAITEFGIQAVSAMTSTNFYVGNAANYEQSANDGAPRTYYWVAIG